MKQALLLIDPYNDFLAEGGVLWPYVKDVARRLNLHANLRALLSAARDQRLLVVFVPHHRWDPGDFDGWKFLTPTHEKAQELRPFRRGTWGAEFHPDFAPRAGEIVVQEHWLHSGFANTDLAYHLANHGVDRLILAGLRANTCLEATARYAVEQGYHVSIAKDATASVRWEEWVATIEVNASSFAHAILTTEEIVARLSSRQEAA